VLGYAELLASELPDGSQHAEMMREITSAGQKAVHLTRQLLTFSRRQAVQPRRVEVGGLLAGMASVLRQLIGERVRLDIHAQPDLWAVTADVGSLEQVVMNLAVNACDAMPSGGTLSIVANNVALDGTGTARQLHAAEGPHVRLAVRDTGTGMDEETRSRMFEPFFTTKDREHGTGLGLATVYAIVEQHRGFIAVETAPGQGTLFEIFLPVAAASEEEDEPARWLSTPTQAAGTVLLVEDDDALRKLASELLQRAGYVVLAGRDAVEARAIERSHAGHIDLLLTDLGLPDDSGQELAADVARRRPGMAVLYTSGHADGMIARHGVRRRDMLLLEKPYSRSTLLARVEQALATSQRDGKGPATRS
jgi:CheY-like chemotaxis protein